MRSYLFLLILLVVYVRAEVLVEQDFTFLYTLTNPYNYTIKVPTYGTPFGFCGSRFCKLSLNDSNFVHRNSFAVPNRKPSSVFLILQAHETKKTNFTVSNYFDFTGSGNYSIWIEDSFISMKDPLTNLVTPFDMIPANLSVGVVEFDSIPLFLAQNKSKHREEEAEEEIDYAAIPTKFPSHTNKITFVKAETSSEKREENLVPPKDLNYDYENFIVAKLKDAARVRLEEGQRRISMDSTEFKLWFDGQGSQQKFNIVKQALDGMITLLKGLKFKILTTKQECGNNAVFFKPGDWSTLYFCDPFFATDLPLVGVIYDSTEDSMYGQVSSVLSLLIYGVNKKKSDESYSRTECLQMAQKKPDTAVQTGDNYAYYLNNLGYDIEIFSIYGNGITAPGGNINIPLKSLNTDTITFKCIGEFPLCNLQTVGGSYYLDTATKDGKEVALITTNKKAWSVSYQGNGAFHLVMVGGSLLTLDDKSFVVKGSDDYQSKWLIKIDGQYPNTRVFELKDSERNSAWFSADLQADALVHCDAASTRNLLQLVQIGKDKRTMFRTRKTPYLFLNRRVLTDAVKLTSDPYWWTMLDSGYFSKTNYYDITCNEKTGFASVYCSNSILNPGYVYTDGIFVKDLELHDLKVGEIGEKDY